MISNSDPNYSNYFAFEAVSATNDAYIAEDPTNRDNATYTDIDSDGNTDYFMSFQVDLQTLINASTAIASSETLTDASSVSIVALTTNNPNAFNQDIAGHDGSTVSGQLDNVDITWASLGATSESGTSITGAQVPEYSNYALLLGIGIFASVLMRRRTA